MKSHKTYTEYALCYRVDNVKNLIRVVIINNYSNNPKYRWSVSVFMEWTSHKFHLLDGLMVDSKADAIKKAENAIQKYSEAKK